MKIRTKKIIITIIFTLLILFLGDVPRIFIKYGLDLFPINWLPTLRIVLIVYAIICLFVPWLLQKQLVILGKSDRLRFSVGTGALVYGLSFTVAPAVLGFGLFLFGSPLAQLPYFLVPAVLDTAAWGIYNICCIDRFHLDL